MSQILVVKAFDKDSGENGEIYYRLIDDNIIEKFSINSNTGELFLRQSLDRENLDYYSFFVVANDGGEVNFFIIIIIFYLINYI